MTAEALRQTIHATPFQPFQIRLPDGTRVPVPHPDFISVGHRIAVVINPDDSYNSIDIALIVAIEHPAPATASGQTTPERHEN
jgi:hypothetical protein